MRITCGRAARSPCTTSRDGTRLSEEDETLPPIDWSRSGFVTIREGRRGSRKAEVVLPEVGGSLSQTAVHPKQAIPNGQISAPSGQSAACA
jgi:hypothetical protein